MASITLSPVVGWLVGETISLYLANTGNQKIGSPIATATVGADSTTTFTGLDPQTRFIATDGTNEIRFSTLTDPAPTSSGGGGSASVFLVQTVDSGYPARGEGTDPMIWIGWDDPTDLMAELDLYVPIPEPS